MTSVKYFFIFILLIVGLFPGCGDAAFAQGESVFPFLLISPAAASNGMGETSVAIYHDDPLTYLTNPAHLGIFGRSNYFSAGYDYADWLPGYRDPDLNYKVFGFNGGVNLQKLFGLGPELSVGVAYSHVRLNLGDFAETSADGPEVLAIFRAYETADNYSIGVGYHSWVSVSLGYTLKSVFSNLVGALTSAQYGITAPRVSMFDLGLFVVVPFPEILGRMKKAPVFLLPELAPVFDLNLGIANNNLGDSRVKYVGDLRAGDPLPRYVRVGVGVELGLSYQHAGHVWRPVVFSWTREANDMLIRVYPAPVNAGGAIIGDPPPADYRNGLGDIRIFDDLIVGRTNPDAIIKTGWQVDFGGMVSVRGGRFLESPEHGNRRFSTSGYTIRLGGLWGFLQAVDVPLETDIFLLKVLTHLDLRYTHSEIDTDVRNHPLGDTEFSSWTLIVSPWD